MKAKRWSIVAIFIAVFVSAIVASLPSKSVSADAANDLMTKVLYRGLSLCYSDTYTNKTIPENGFNGASSLVTDKGKKDGIIKVPNSVANSLNDGDISCAELFNGYSGIGGKMQGLIARTGKQVNKNTITSMGYHEQSASGGEEKGCVSFEYTYNKKNSNGVYEETNPVSTNEICFEIDPDDGSILDVIDNYSSFTSPLYIYNNGDSILISGPTIYDPTLYSTLWAYNVTWDKFKSAFESRVQGINGYPECDVVYDLNCNSGRVYKISEVHAEKTMGGAKEYEKDSMDAATKALRYFTGNSNAKFDDYKYTLTDTYNLASEYVKQNASSLVVGSSSKCTTDLAKAKEETGYALRDGDKWCPVSGVQNVGGTFNIIEQEQGVLFSTNFTGVVTQLMGLNYAKLADEGTTPGVIGSGGLPNDSDNGGSVDAGDASTIAPCYEGSGALGWIICPVLEAVGTATEWMYDHAIEPLLQIRADKLFSGTDGIYVGWSTFRNFSNVLFAIAFAVIILAQVTGIGISNYNIKKILPRFVVVVVLVNISYILCQLAVDISNILGFSIRELFDRLPVSDEFQVTGGQMMKVILNGLGLAAGVGVGVSTALSSVVVVSTLKYFMVPLVLAFIGCLLSVLFFFIAMSVRQTGVVILVVLAPVAIVCYALPNTKSLFDKWRKLFTALLMVYPICGLLMGGGNYVSALLLSAIPGSQEGMGTLYTITALLVSILPFFLIPSLVKGSMAMMGNLGMKISNFGNGISRGLKSGVMNSRAVKEHQAEEQRRLELARNKTRVGRYSNERGKAGGLVGRARRALGMNENLSRRAQIRNAQALENVDKITGTSANAMSIGWENSGRANDFEWLREQYEDATDKLLANPYDYEALEIQKAASAQLAKTKPGRAELYAANQKIGEKVAAINAGTDEQAKINARQTMLRTGNNLMRSSSGDIARSPLVAEQIKAFQDTNTNYNNLNETVLTESVNGLNERTVTELGSKDLKAYENAARQGQLSPTQMRKLSSITSRALRNPHLQDAFKDENLSALNRIANYQYDSPVGQHEQITKSNGYAIDKTATKAYSGITSEDLGRIHNQIRTGGLEGEEKDRVLRNLNDTLMRSIDDSDTEVQLKPEQAARISEILQDSGYNMDGARDAYGYTADQLRDKLDMATGIKVPHTTPASDQAPDSAQQAPGSPRPTPPIITVDANASMDRIRDIARENPGPRQRSRQNDQNSQNNNEGNPPIILT